MRKTKQKFIIRRTVICAFALLFIVVGCSLLFSHFLGAWNTPPSVPAEGTPSEPSGTPEMLWGTTHAPVQNETNASLSYFLMLVNAEHPMGNTVPQGLINIYDTYGHSETPLRDVSLEMNEEAYLHCREMFQAAQSQGIEGAYILSAYRSYEKQVSLYADYIQQGGASDPYPQVSRPGESEHQSGLVVDIAISSAYGDTQATNDFARTYQGQWFMEHCWEYGFILRYPLDKQHITGIAYESWHFRYVGVEHAMAMKNMNLCLEEYLAYLVQ